MFLYKNFFINIILFIIIIYSNCFSNPINISKISQGFANVTWLNNTPYLYYIDIKDYYESEENVVEFIVGFKNVIQNMSIYLLTTNKTEEEIKNNLVIPVEEDQKKNERMKKRLSSDLYVYANVFKKTSKEQTFHIILIIPKNIINSLYVQISLSKRIKNFLISKNNFENNTILRKNLEVSRNVEDFYKFSINDISVKDQNIVFFIPKFNIASFYVGNITINQFKGNRIFIIPKNSSKETNHIIYLSTIGEAGEVSIEISIIKNDIIFLETNRKPLFYLEKIKYEEDLYIVENYGRFNTSSDSNKYNLSIIPLYGNYSLTYYNSYNTINLTDLFTKSNGTILDKRISLVSGTSNFYRLSCSSPCAIKFGYISYKEEEAKILKEGESKIKYFPPDKFKRESYDLDINDKNKKYYTFYELYEEEEIYNQTSNYAFISYKGMLTEALNKNHKSGSQTIYYNYKEFHIIPQLGFISYTGAIIKFYLTSNLLYNNIVEGLNIIDFSNKNLAFKIRKDILYDYVLINIYSHNKENFLIINYDVQILSSDKIDDNGKVLCELPTQGEYNKKEINLKYSNPYNKYNTKIKEDELMYIVFRINNINKNDFPIYFNIKYYYNNLVIKIPNKVPKILKIAEEYKIFGGKEYAAKNNLILNINKCNLNKNYAMQTYYENFNNKIWKDKITDKRNIILHQNIFNESNIKLEELNENNNISNSSELKINQINQNNYLVNNDIYMNYFSMKESLLYLQNITKDYSIKYQNKEKIHLRWSPYITKSFGIPSLTIQYNIYIFPKNSKVNSICQMSLIPPNYTIINKTEYNLKLPKGNYRINIIASVINEEFPMITFYDDLDIKVSRSLNEIIYIILGIFIGFVIFMSIILCFLKKKSDNGRKTIDRKFPYQRDSFWISLVQQRENNLKNRNNKKINLFDEDDEDYIFKDD